jgi:hypothetical protein
MIAFWSLHEVKRSTKGKIYFTLCINKYTPKAFKNSVVVDSKKDVDNIMKTLSKTDLIEEFTRENSKPKFYRFLDVKFHVYEMNTPMGKSKRLPDHFKEGANEKALIKYENCDDYLCFWRCLAYCQTKPEDPRNINKRMKYLFNDYYNNEKEIKNYSGVEFVVCNKEYTRLPGPHSTGGPARHVRSPFHYTHACSASWQHWPREL